MLSMGEAMKGSVIYCWNMCGVSFLEGDLAICIKSRKNIPWSTTSALIIYLKKYSWRAFLLMNVQHSVIYDNQQKRRTTNVQQYGHNEMNDGTFTHHISV